MEKSVRAFKPGLALVKKCEDMLVWLFGHL